MRTGEKFKSRRPLPPRALRLLPRAVRRYMRRNSAQRRRPAKPPLVISVSQPAGAFWL